MLRPVYSLLLVAGLAVSGCVDDGPAAGAAAHQAVAVPGDTVLKVQHSEVIPNAFGGKDVLGRTRDTGATTVSFVSAANGVATFRRQDVEIFSQKTTLNSTPTVISTGRKASDVIVLPAFTPRDQIGPMRETTFTLSAAAGRNTITIDGHTLTVLAVQGGQIIYKAN